MRRGEIWTVASGPNYAGKPRPSVIIQNDRFDPLESIAICGFTTDPTDAPLFRILVEPSSENGLRTAARLMVDKIATVPKTKFGMQIGVLGPEDTVRLNRAIVRFLAVTSAAL